MNGPKDGLHKKVSLDSVAAVLQSQILRLSELRLMYSACQVPAYLPTKLCQFDISLMALFAIFIESSKNGPRGKKGSTSGQPALPLITRAGAFRCCPYIGQVFTVQIMPRLGHLIKSTNTGYRHEKSYVIKNFGQSPVSTR